jgi:predicted negative regulator of RcsB-dependent stress response
MVAEYDRMGETAFNSTITEILAQVLCDQGRYDEGESFAERSREMAAEDDFASQSGWRMAEARILAHRGDGDEALRLADEAIAITETTDYLVWHGDAHETRGQVLEAAGRSDDAREAYETALEAYERKEAVVAAARIRQRLES